MMDRVKQKATAGDLEPQRSQVGEVWLTIDRLYRIYNLISRPARFQATAGVARLLRGSRTSPSVECVASSYSSRRFGYELSEK